MAEPAASLRSNARRAPCRTATPRSSPASPATSRRQGYGFNAAFSDLFARSRLSQWRRRHERGVRADHVELHARIRRDTRGFRPHLHCPARQQRGPSDGAVQAAADDGGLSRRAADLRSDRAVRLRAARLRRRGFSGDDRGSRAVARASLCAHRRRGRAPQCLCRRSGDLALRRRGRKQTIFTSRPASGRTPSGLSRPTTTIP